MAVGVASLVFATGAFAQVKVEVAANVGHYSPLGSFEPAAEYSVGLPNDPGALSGVDLGGELRLWVAPRIGFALGGSTASSSVGGGSTPNGYHSPIPARVTMGSVQVLFRVSGENSRARVWLGAGGGAVQHGGSAYAAYGKPVNTAGVLSIGSAIRIAGGLSADAGLTTMMYHLNVGPSRLEFGSQVSERGPQADLLLRTGLSYSWH